MDVSMRLFSQSGNDDDAPVKEFSPDSESSWVLSVKPPTDDQPSSSHDGSIATHNGKAFKKWFHG